MIKQLPSIVKSQSLSLENQLDNLWQADKKNYEELITKATLRPNRIQQLDIIISNTPANSSDIQKLESNLRTYLHTIGLDGNVSYVETRSDITRVVKCLIYPLAPEPQSSVLFLGEDLTTKGSWKNKYGFVGGKIFSSTNDIVGLIGTDIKFFTWLNSTTDIRALQKENDLDRLAACIYTDTTMSINIDTRYTKKTKVSFYFVDWDRTKRAQKIEIFESSTKRLLDTQVVSDFGEGKYLSWNMEGNLDIKFSRASVGNIILSAVFFDEVKLMTTKTIKNSNNSNNSHILNTDAPISEFNQYKTLVDNIEYGDALNHSGVAGIGKIVLGLTTK